MNIAAESKRQSIFSIERMTYKNAKSNTWWLAIIAAALVAGFAMYNYGGAQDNDMWWLFATGREIVNNGIPYMNPFSVWDDQAVVLQQWIPAVVSYLIYNTFGFMGIGVMVALLTFALAMVAVAFARTVSKQGAEVAWVLAAIVIGCASAYLSVRPQVWSMIAYLCVLIVMEKYRQSGKKKYLLWLPVIMAIHMNFHMSLALFDLVIVGAYLLPSSLSGSVKDKFGDYNRLAIVAALVAMALASCLNPYGIDGALYLVNSIDAASYQDYISEMGAMVPWGKSWGVCIVALIVVGGAAIGRNGFKHIDLPLSAMFVLTCVMSFQHIRNVWLVAIFAYALFMRSCIYNPISFRTKYKLLQDDPPKLAVSCVLFAVIIGLGAFNMTDQLMREPEDSASTPIVAADWLDENADGKVNVFTHFNTGGYLEWRGYKVAMDARPELWNDKITKNGEDRYFEYVDMSKEDLSCGDYMDNKTFDYMIVNTDAALYRYLLGSISFDKVLDGDGYVLFQARNTDTTEDGGVVPQVSAQVETFTYAGEESAEYNVQ